MNDGKGDPTTQQLLTVLVQSTAELHQSNKQQNQKLDVLTDQIGYLTEVVTTGFAKLKELAQQQAETAKRQEQNITRLAGIVQADLKELAQQQSETKELAQQQSETAKRQEQNITRLVGIVEALVQQRS